MRFGFKPKEHFFEAQSGEGLNLESRVIGCNYGRWAAFRSDLQKCWALEIVVTSPDFD
jgi:hypothetical protein